MLLPLELLQTINRWPCTRLPTLKALSQNRTYRSSTSRAKSNARLRFAPSPTGFLHLGGFRTALYNYLLARNYDGQLILRIEDTDQSRLVPDAQKALLDSLTWAGIRFDEGPHLQECTHGPYVQSERLDIYRKYIDQLLSTGHAYPCFCTADRLNALRLELKARNAPSIYDRHCLHTLSREEASQRMQAGQSHVVRFKSSNESAQSYNDLIYGQVSQSSAEEDFILLKTDGFPTYHFANVVDDHLMQISHVFRGEEWIPSTPKHLALYRAFQWTPPEFGHFPILVGSKGNKLSKRDGDVRIDQFLANGWEPQAMANFVALLSARWNQEIMTMQEMIQNVSLTNLNKHRSQADLKKLAHINKQHLLRTIASPKSQEALKIATKFSDLLQSKFPEATSQDSQDLVYILQVLPILLERASNLKEMVELSDCAIFFCVPQWRITDKYLETASVAQEVEAVPRTYASFMEMGKVDGTARTNLMKNLRYILTGTKNGPPISQLAQIFGPTRFESRIDQFFAWYSSHKA